MERRTSLIASLLLAMVLLPSLGALADGATLQTDSTEEYSAGDAVTFSGGGYVPGNSYKMDISLLVDGGDPILVVVEEIMFSADESGNVPSDPPVSWAIPFDAEDGTYEANVYDVVAVVNVASCRFEVHSGLGDRLGAVAGELEGVISTEVEEEVRERLFASLRNCMKKVDAALALLEEGRDKVAMNQLRAAKNMLRAFIHKVMAQDGKSIDTETASELIGLAEDYIEYIDSVGDPIVSTMDPDNPANTPIGLRIAQNARGLLQRQESHLRNFITNSKPTVSVSGTEGGGEDKGNNGKGKGANEDKGNNGKGKGANEEKVNNGKEEKVNNGRRLGQGRNVNEKAKGKPS